MAIIVDPDDLNQGTEVTFNTGSKTITLNVAGNLSSDGVTLKALYSFCKEEWKDDASLIPFKFPFTPITDESFELIEGWDFANDASRYLIRTAGWAVRDTSGNTTQQWAGIIGLGSIEANDQIYFDQGNGVTNTQLQGQVNQAVQILSDPNGDGNFADGFDRRSQFDLYVREQAQIYGKSSLTAIGVTGNMSPIAYRFPLSTSSDLKISATDNSIDTSTPYTDATNQFTATDISFTSPSTITTGGTVNFSGLTAGDTIIVTGTTSNNGTYEVSTANATTITVASTDIATESSGSSFTIAESLMSITYYTSAQSRNIGGTSYNFGIIIDGAGGTAEQIYEFVQRQLRRSFDINAEGTATDVVGQTADSLLLFVGNDLETLNATNAAGGGTGVYIDNFQAADTNRITFRDNTEPTTPVGFPFVAVTTLTFNANLQNDSDAIYRVFFTTNPAGNYDTSTAVTVHTNDELESTDISFTAPDLIDTAGAVDFTDKFAVGEFIEVATTSTTNDGFYEIATVSATQIELVEQTISTENAATAGTSTLSQSAMGTIGGNTSIQFDFDYQNNAQGGRTANTDADITVVAIGLTTGQYVRATGTIGESTQNSVALVAPLERNYENPV